MAELQKTATSTLGTVAVFDYNGIPHVGVVTAFAGTDHFTIIESNYGGDYVQTRDVDFDDPRLLGFYSFE